jgi:hypothetical protein
MRRRLSDTFVERLKPSPCVLRVWDEEVKGFGLRVTPAGHKSYIFQFTRDKRKVQATIGSAQCWSSDEARERARELRKLHEDGKDARGTLKEDRKARDLEELVACWREDYKPKLRPHSQASYESRLNRILIHDLRRTINTVCAELGYPPQVFDALLGHKVAGIAGVYTWLCPAGGILAEASQATADWIAAALDGRKPRLGVKVRALPARSEEAGSKAAA